MTHLLKSLQVPHQDGKEGQPERPLRLATPVQTAAVQLRRKSLGWGTASLTMVGEKSLSVQLWFALPGWGWGCPHYPQSVPLPLLFPFTL